MTREQIEQEIKAGRTFWHYYTLEEQAIYDKPDPQSFGEYVITVPKGADILGTVHITSQQPRAQKARGQAEKERNLTTMKKLEQEIRKLQVKAQDISHGVWTDAGSLADCLERGEVSEDEAREQLEELRGQLEEARSNT